jgi:hypothetical protein
MSKPCESMQDRIADRVLGLLDPQQEAGLLHHIETCPGCREYLEALEHDSRLLTEYGRQLDSQMDRAAKAAAEAVVTLPAASVGRTTLWRKLMASSLVKLAAAAIIAVVVSVAALLGPKSQTPSTLVPAMLASAMAAENALFTGQQIVHIKNEITVYPCPAFKQLGSSWLPVSSLKADGRLRLDQLKLSLEEQPYTVTDQAWYDPVSGRFVRVLQTDKAVAFANSYDGESVYASQVSSEGRLQIVKERVTEKFTAPLKPGDFFGLAAGMQSGLDSKDSMVLGTEAGTLSDGTAVHVFKVGTLDSDGQTQTFWLFKVRDDDKTIAEKQFIVDGQPHIDIRRVFAKPVDRPEIGWDLAELSGLNSAAGQATVAPDMVIPDVSVRQMVEKADFETYVFKKVPAWTKAPAIADVFDPASPGKRMFVMAFPADDHRSIVLVQSPSYNAMLGGVVKQGTLVYTSPNGFKVWGGGRSKWLAQILIQSARAWVKDAPSEDRVGFILESPANTFPALAINGQVTDEELHGLIDSLVPARDYIAGK